MADFKETVNFSGIVIRSRVTIEEDGCEPREEIRETEVEFVPNSVLVTGENYGDFKLVPK